MSTDFDTFFHSVRFNTAADHVLLSVDRKRLLVDFRALARYTYLKSKARGEYVLSVEITYPKFTKDNQRLLAAQLENYFTEKYGVHSKPLDIQSEKVWYVCFQYPVDTVKALLKNRMNISPEIIELDAGTYYIRQCYKPHDPMLYVNDVEWLFAKSNVPYIAIHDELGAIKHFDLYGGIKAEENKAFFYREDLNFAPRSTWEANVARTLRYLNIPFRYEDTLFIRHAIKDGQEPDHGYYIPDFILDDNRIIEVKGFWSYDSRQRTLEFMKQHPEYKYYIIDCDWYFDINKVFQDRIPEWEDGFLVAENKDVAIVGIGYGARKNVVGKLQIGDVLHLERDAANQFDSNAIIAYTNERQEVGFVSADWACIYAAKMDAGMVFDATITAIEKKKIVVTLKRKNLNDTILYDIFRES